MVFRWKQERGTLPMKTERLFRGMTHEPQKLGARPLKVLQRRWQDSGQVIIMNKYKVIVQTSLGRRTLLEQLAEECNELAQAALKTIRAEGLSKNATTVSEDEATANLVEEAGDVLMCLEVLGLVPDGTIKQNPKWQRWAKRVHKR